MLLEDKNAEELYPPPPPYESVRTLQFMELDPGSHFSQIAQSWRAPSEAAATVGSYLTSTSISVPPPQDEYQDVPTQSTAGTPTHTTASTAIPNITATTDDNVALTSSPYLNSAEVQMRAPAHYTKRLNPARLSDLPSSIVLQIVYDTFPKPGSMYGAENKAQLQRETLFWLETSLRLLNRVFYSGEY